MEARSADSVAPRTLLRSTVMGVSVQVDRSWALTLGVSAAAAAWLAHELVAGISGPGALLLGAVVSLALWASLLAHELAHAAVAMRAGIEIVHIRFFATGALCRRADTIDAPRDQFMVAAAGPLASAALGLAALAAALAAAALGLPVPVRAALWFVAFANGMIAASNLLPILPLDGGTLLHAIFWRASRDRRAAAARARRSGREFARIVVTTGVLMVAASGEALLGLAVAAFGVYLLKLPVP
jgi:Zn-dependent protease